jgi:uncharacterized protein with von Willebrand factor type A (vWA) domain
MRPAEERLLGFAAALRSAGLAAEPGCSADFVRALRGLPLVSIADVRRAGRIVFARSPGDFPLYDAAFDAWFCGAATPITASAPPPEDDADRLDETALTEEESLVLAGEARGKSAAADHLSGRKAFAAFPPATLRRIEAVGREAVRALPRVQSRRRQPHHRGDRIHLRRTAMEAKRHFGEPLLLKMSARPKVARPLLLLLDVSGSMKAQSETLVRLAHALARNIRRLEVFTFGTALTRITPELDHRDPEAALARLAAAVRDFDGGTRIGPSLREFLRLPRASAKARGAVVVIVSDGLERGDPEAMRRAVARLSLLAHRLIWASPLAADPAYRPLTRGMAAILPHIDRLADGSGIEAFRRLMAALPEIEAAPRRRAAFAGGR